MEKARHAPVTVEKTGRKYVVLMSHDEYERLQAIEDRQWALAAEEAEKSGYLGPEESMKILMQAMEQTVLRKLVIDRDAAKFLQDLDTKQYKQVGSKMLSLMVNATPADYSQLKGSAYYRVDSGEYRIVYRFDAGAVFIVLIGKRNGDEVYDKLKG